MKLSPTSSEVRGRAIGDVGGWEKAEECCQGSRGCIEDSTEVEV